MYLFVFLRNLTNSSRKFVRTVNYITFLDPQMVSKSAQQDNKVNRPTRLEKKTHKSTKISQCIQWNALNSLHSALENDWIFLQFQRNRRCTWANNVRLINLHAQLPSRLSPTWQDEAACHSKHDYFIAKPWLLPINSIRGWQRGQWEMFIVMLPLDKYPQHLKLALSNKAFQRK